MTGNLAEHTPAPLPLVERYYNALGFSTPGTEFDPSTGTYHPDPPWPPADYIESRIAEMDITDPEYHDAMPADSAEWITQLEAS